MSSLKLPKGWSKRAPISNGVIDYTFIVFKSPLDYKYKNKVKELAFEVDSVFEYVRDRQLFMGLWIDLTLTNYYDKYEVTRKNCRFVKLKCRGNGFIPSKNLTNQFINECLAYKSQFPDGVIGVHCTHGHNRTGFFIVCYLVECKNWSVTSAVNEFSKVRPPGIYRENYIAELHKRYGKIPRTLEFSDSKKTSKK